MGPARRSLPVLIVALVSFLASCASGSRIAGEDVSVKPGPFPRITAANAARLARVASLDLPTSNFTSVEILPYTLELMAGDRSGEVVVWSKDSREYRNFLPPTSWRASRGQGIS